jgi:hypothetical protein
MHLNDVHVYLFESPFYTDSVAEAYWQREGLVVPFSLLGKINLEKQGIPCELPDERIELPDFNLMGVENLQIMGKICKLIDQKMQERISFIGRNRLEIAQASLFTLKIFFDTLCSADLVLQKLLKKINPRSITTFVQEVPSSKMFNNQVDHVSLLLRNLYADNYSIREIPVTLPTTGSKAYFKQKLRKGLKFAYSSIPRKKQTENILVLKNHHDVPLLIKRVLKNIDVYYIGHENNFLKFFPGKAFSISSNNFEIEESSDLLCKVFSELWGDLNYRQQFEGRERLSGLVHKILKLYFVDVLTPLLAQSEQLQNRLNGIAPKLLLTTDCRLDLGQAFLLEVAKANQIPVVSYQEGGGAGIVDWPLFNLDVDHSDFFLTYGEGVCSSSVLKDGKAEKIAVGSIRLEFEKKKLVNRVKAPEGKIYVVLDNLKKNTHQHYPHNGGFFTQAYRHQLIILDALKEFGDVQFVIKTVKDNEELYQDYLIPGQIELETAPLTKCLRKGDAFILEWPSTVLQECLLTGQPLALLYNPLALEFDPRANGMLEKRVRIESNPLQFSDVIRLLIQDMRNGTPMVNANQFMNNYMLMDQNYRRLEIFFSKLLE